MGRCHQQDSDVAKRWGHGAGAWARGWTEGRPSGHGGTQGRDTGALGSLRDDLGSLWAIFKTFLGVYRYVKDNFWFLLATSRFLWKLRDPQQDARAKVGVLGSLRNLWGCVWVHQGHRWSPGPSGHLRDPRGHLKGMSGSLRDVLGPFRGTSGVHRGPLGPPWRHLGTPMHTRDSLRATQVSLGATLRSWEPHLGLSGHRRVLP